MIKPGIAIHGGAGTILRSTMTREKEDIYTTALREALHAGYTILHAGGSALDAIEAAIRSLEDCPLFNAYILMMANTRWMPASCPDAI
jgi:beta-aspartyl-peptidase (threonine type)